MEGLCEMKLTTPALFPKPQTGARFLIVLQEQESWITKILVRFGVMRPAAKLSRIWEVTDGDTGAGRWIEAVEGQNFYPLGGSSNV